MASSAIAVAPTPNLRTLFALAHDDFDFRMRLRTNPAAALTGIELPDQTREAIATRKLEHVRLALHLNADVTEFTWVAIALSVVTSTAVVVA